MKGEKAALSAVITGKRDKDRDHRPALARQATLPAILSPRQQKLHGTPPPCRPSLTPAGPVRSKTVIDGSELLTTRDRLQGTLQPHTLGLADDWLKQAPHADRKVIERVLRMQEKKHQLDHALRRSLQPNAKKSVENWLESANESERQVALQFFTSVAGAKLMGSTIDEQKGKLQQVIKALEANKGQQDVRDMRRSLDSSQGRESKLKFVRLLDPQTRANRWMHTTWHHLPEYRNDNPVSNRSSHYITPHAPTPRHFVIHPDWG